MLTALIEAYYWDLRLRVVIDASRVWPAYVSTLATLLPSARIICCVRNPAWIIDSVERLVQRNSLRVSKMFEPPQSVTVYSRAEALVKGGFLGTALNALRTGWFSEHAQRLIAVRYESLAERPGDTIGRLYEFLGEAPFKHDFSDVAYEETEFDARLNTPGLHRVRSRVEHASRATVLPPDLFGQLDSCFWNDASQNPRGVTML